jgi:hypothetical protein
MISPLNREAKSTASYLYLSATARGGGHGSAGCSVPYLGLACPCRANDSYQRIHCSTIPVGAKGSEHSDKAGKMELGEKRRYRYRAGYLIRVSHHQPVWMESSDSSTSSL